MNIYKNLKTELEHFSFKYYVNFWVYIHKYVRQTHIIIDRFQICSIQFNACFKNFYGSKFVSEITKVGGHKWL